MSDAFTLTVLGCGSSSGTPAIGCGCATCVSTDTKNQRSRCSAYIHTDTQGWLVDTGTDLRQQALRENIGRVDGVLYTHPHADHLNGIDDLRAFCYRQQAAIDVYGNQHTIANIQSRFDYAFLPAHTHWNKPVLSAHVLPESQNGAPVLHLGHIPVWHYGVPHGRWTTSAWRVGNVAWLTDLNHISDSVIEALQGLDYLFLDCLMDHAYPSHLSVAQAFDYAQRIGAGQTYLIHMTHMLEYHALNRRCPPRIAAAFDGLRIQSKWPAKHEFSANPAPEFVR